MPGVTDPQFTGNKGSDTNPTLPDMGLVGSDINGYRVDKLLDQGGMSWVYEAVHPEIGRRAAVKVLKAEGHNDAESRNRFLLEAKAVAALTNKHVVEIWNYGILPDGRQYLMMPLLEGEALDRYLSRMQTLPPAQALQIIEQALNALSEAHKKNIVHRDVKPGNIFLVREHTGELLVKVMDFGLAAARPVAMPEGDGPAKASWVAGTPCYVAPEQAKGLVASPAADLYALGVTLYELLAGEPPFPDSPSQPVAELLRKHLSEPPPPISTKVSNLPEGVEELINSLLEKDPARRPASADLARSQVQRLLKRMASDATAVKGMTLPTGAPAHVPRQATEKVLGPPPADVVSVELNPQNQKKRPGALMVVLLLLFLLLGFGVWKLASGGDEKAVVPLPEPAKVAEVVKAPEPAPVAAPEPVKAAPAPEPAPVKPADPEPLAVPVKKQPALKVTVKERVPTVERGPCAGDDDWKRATREKDLPDLQKLAIAADQYEEWAKIEPDLTRKIAEATPNNCDAVQQQIDVLARKYLSMRKH
ncbi:MAG: serine/threonine-protein kinase [Myxococcaceae bacterium]